MPELMFKERVSGFGEKIFNNPLTQVNSNGQRYRTTRMELPSWVDRDVMTEGVDEVASTSFDVSVERISERRPIDILLDSPKFPDVSKAYDTAQIFDEIQEQAPTGDTEIVDPWIHNSAAADAVLSGWAREYGKNSSLSTDSDDSNWPGVTTSDFNFNGTERGSEVSSQGYATLETPAGSTQVDVETGKTEFTKDSIGAAVVDPGSTSGGQYHGTVAQFKDLAKTPIEDPVRFPTISGEYGNNHHQMPNVINQAPPEKSEGQQVSFNVSADQDQDVRFAFRNPNDYSQTVTENSITVPQGTSEVQFQISATPAVPPVAVEMQDQGGSVQSVESYSMEAQ